MKKLIILIILVLIAVILIKHVKKEPMVAPANTVENSVTYACTQGALTAVYTDNQVSLKLLDGRTLVLPQVVSGSGTRYESDGVVLVTKGDNAILTENGTETYTNCLANGTPAATTGTTQTFTDTGKTFSFMYPTDLSVTSGDMGYTPTWRNNVQSLGLVLAQVIIPKSSQPNTNFSEAKFTVGTSSDTQSIHDCLIATNGEIAKGSAMINGVTYQKFTLGDAGAGNLYDTTSYRTMRNSQCYAVEYTIHSTNIGNYDPSQDITAFDQASVTTELETMAQSFTFL